MKLLNLACGNVRPTDDIWTNLDCLHPVLFPGTPERMQLDSEKNYVEWNLSQLDLPFANYLFDGILASHLIEHWNCKEAVEIMTSCHRCLKPGGILVVSVPDASYFRRVYAEDNAENCQRLFGQPLYEAHLYPTFFRYALWFAEHQAILTEDSLWCYFVRAGFKNPSRFDLDSFTPTSEVMKEIVPLMNRQKFSLNMVGMK